MFYAVKSGNLDVVKKIGGFDECSYHEIKAALKSTCKKNNAVMLSYLLSILSDRIVGAGYICELAVKFLGKDIYRLLAPLVEEKEETLNLCMRCANFSENINAVEHYYGLGATNGAHCLRYACDTGLLNMVLYWINKGFPLEDRIMGTKILNNVDFLKKIIHLLDAKALLEKVYYLHEVDDNVIEFLQSKI